jgi:hypothetical protein
MPYLAYCYVEIFGADLDVERLKVALGSPDAMIGNSGKGKAPEPRSAIPALKQGNCRQWKSPRDYYVRPAAVPEWDFVAEEDHIYQCINRWLFIRDVLPKFQTETTEVWLKLIYRATESEQPTGVYFSRRLLSAVYELGASISTEVAFGDLSSREETEL